MASDPFFYSPVTKRMGRINEFINMSGNVSPYDLIESILLEQHVHYYFRYGLEEALQIRSTFLSPPLCQKFHQNALHCVKAALEEVKFIW